MDCLIFCGGFGTIWINDKVDQFKSLIRIASKKILRHIILIYETK